MNGEERRLITELFDRLARSDAQPRNAEAERLIAERLRDHPGAPYVMAQTIIMQNIALERAEARIRELEDGGAGRGGFLPDGGGAWDGFAGERRDAPGGGRPAGERPLGAPDLGRARPGSVPAIGAAAGSAPAMAGGGGFLAGAAQAAVGVAGGMMLAEAAKSIFGAGRAEAAPSAGVQPALDTGAGEAAGAQESGGIGGFFERLFGGGDQTRQDGAQPAYADDADYEDALDEDFEEDDLMGGGDDFA